MEISSENKQQEDNVVFSKYIPKKTIFGDKYIST